MNWMLYKVYDCNGTELPQHYSGRNRTYMEAKLLVDRLNKNGEHAPYISLPENQKFEEQLKYKL